nr:MAG: hypothetical protein [Bacteriophage sp.]
MYRDKRGIYYKNIFYKILGVPSPSLNMCYGGMEAVRQAACDKMVKRARLVEKWEIRHLRKTEKVVMFMGYSIKQGKRYAVWNCGEICMITESKEREHEKL